MSTISSTTRPQITPPTSQVILNPTSPGTANTEFSTVLSSTVKKLMIKGADGLTRIQFTFVSGESGTKFVTVPAGAVYDSGPISLSGATLYMQVDGISKVIQVEQWV